MLKSAKIYFQENTLNAILWMAFLVRLVSVLFSRGYGMHDDHYLVIEAAQSWVDGFDYNNWLPENSVNGEPTGHSFFYVGLHYIFFLFCKVIGLNDPGVKMLIVRLFHASWSLLTVYFGYKITEKLSTKENARIVGLLLALYWFYPILSVRTMVEMVCVPFMLMSFYFLIRKDALNWKDYIIAGVFMGFAIAVRLQTYLIWGGIGLVLLYNKKIIGAILFGIFSLSTLFLTQVTDLFLWGYPFAEIGQYVFYNSTHYDDYITQSWFQYFLLIGGLLIPPVSLFILFGYFRAWKKYALLFLPTLIFLIFHSLYPNKQERFILPILPLIIILGIMGWRAFMEGSDYWKNRSVLYNRIIRGFWILNITALIFITPASTKKSRIDTMSYLRGLDDVNGLLIERLGNYGCYLMPRFYHGKWDNPHFCYSKNEVAKYKDDNFEDLILDRNINYCLFIEEEDIEARIESIKNSFPEMKKIAVIEPSYIDRLLHFLNPVNENETIYIYKLY